MTTLTICVTVDWEGEHLQDCNLNAMAMLRRSFPDIPLTHFICPAYFTRVGHHAMTRNKINNQILPHDEVGLHVHSWKSLVEASGVFPRVGPSRYLDGVGPFVCHNDRGLDIGHGVPLGAYAKEEIDKIIVYSRKLLSKHIIGKDVDAITSFRCGGWMSADPVQSALEDKGFSIDSSSTDAIYFAQIKQRLLDVFRLRLGFWVCDLWGNAEKTAPVYCTNSKTIRVQPGGGDSSTQPYSINRVMQIPDNGILADYLSEEKMYDGFMHAWNSPLKGDVVHVCGFHQESAMGQNVYEERPNIDLFMRALRRFKEHVAQVAPKPNQDQTIPQIPSIFVPGEPAAPETRDIVYKTIREASKLSFGDNASRASLNAPLQSGGSIGRRHFG